MSAFVDDKTVRRLNVLDEHGGRQVVHPADVRGPWQRARAIVGGALVAFLLVLPWIDVAGRPAVLFDVPARRFFLFGATFNATDVPLLFFLATGGAFALIVGSALWGRAWCAWGCPQTVLLDQVYRRIERAIEGPRNARIALAAAPWTARKVARKAAKHAAYVVVTLALARTLVAFFDGGWLATLIVAAPLYGNFWWFREQTCLILCPYGRLQSALQDKDTIVVAYDARRGEPRGKPGATTGDCVDCRRCVQACPTAIDVRDGVQMDCLGCMACVDACDDVMAKLHRPRGLVRLDSQRGIESGRRRFLRPRVAVYAVAALVGLTVATTFAVGRLPFEANVVRVPGAPYVVHDGVVRNQLLVHVVDRSGDGARLTLSGSAAGADVVLPQPVVQLAPGESRQVPVLIARPLRASAAGGRAHLRVVDDEGRTKDLDVAVLGPSP